MTNKEYCCITNLPKIAIILTFIEIFLAIDMIIGRIVVGGLDDIEIFIVGFVSFMLAYAFELMGIIDKNFAFLCFNVVIRCILVITLIVMSILWFDKLNDQSILLFTIP